MARKMQRVNNTAPSNENKNIKETKQPTVAEMREWYAKNKGSLERFEKAQDGLINLKDVTKNSTKTISSFSKETLRQYLRNVSSNERNLRNLARYLFYRSMPFYRLCIYYANMFELGAREVIPQYDLSNPPDKDSILKDYYATLDVLDNMNLQYEFYQAYVTCFREDVSYNCAYYDDTGFFLLPLDPDYMRINGYFSDGSFASYMDVTWFNSRRDILEAWGSPFTDMVKQYEKDGIKWQLLPPEYNVTLKYRSEEYDIILSPFVPLFNAIISLSDLEDIAAIADEQEIYKLIFLEMENLSGTKNENDFKFSPELYINYFQRLINEALPDYVGAALVPGELKSISFSDTSKANDTNRIADATKTLFNSSGGSILNGATISGATAFEAMIEADTQFALSSLLPQTELIVNRLLKFYVGDNASRVHFFEVSCYTKDKLSKKLLESCQYGFSNILAYNSLNNISERDTLVMNYVENDCLDLVSKFRPLQSSYTQSGSDTGGAPEKDLDELTDDGEASRDKDTAS